jgi:prepilin-type N-terminal cleavage/methylation domain-containing protein
LRKSVSGEPNPNDAIRNSDGAPSTTEEGVKRTRPSRERRFASFGFTLIELVVVVAIIGILAAIAVSQLYGFAQKAKQSEAKEMLASIYTVESAYFSDKATYGSLLNVGFAPAATPRYYKNVMTQFTYTGGTSFTGSCSANLDNDSTLDVWQVTQKAREPKNLSNDIRN